MRAKIQRYLPLNVHGASAYTILVSPLVGLNEQTLALLRLLVLPKQCLNSADKVFRRARPCLSSQTPRTPQAQGPGTRTLNQMQTVMFVSAEHLAASERVSSWRNYVTCQTICRAKRHIAANQQLNTFCKIYYSCSLSLQAGLRTSEDAVASGAKFF